MCRILSSIILMGFCAVSAFAGSPGVAKYSGEIFAEFHTPGYDNTRLDSLPAEGMLVCSFHTGDIVANHTIELYVRAKKADGKFTKWKSTSYKPGVNYDSPEQSFVTEVIDSNILRAVGGYHSYTRNRDGEVPEKTIVIYLPTFDDVADSIVQYESKIKYTNDCIRGGKCVWSIK